MGAGLLQLGRGMIGAGREGYAQGRISIRVDQINNHEVPRFTSGAWPLMAQLVTGAAFAGSRQPHYPYILSTMTLFDRII